MGPGLENGPHARAGCGEGLKEKVEKMAEKTMP